MKGFKNLKKIKLDLTLNHLGENEENMKEFGNCLKELVNLRSLTLILNSNNLGQGTENIKLLGEILVNMKHLKSLTLNFQSNNIGKEETFKGLVEGFKGLSKLSYFNLDLSKNDLRLNKNLLKSLN